MDLFQREGYHATSWRRLVQESGAPWGSAHHYFPGGKEQLGVAAVEVAAASVTGMMEDCFSRADSAADGIRRLFVAGAASLKRSGFQKGCPVTTVALETVPASPAMTDACRNAFESWTAAITAGLLRDGIPQERAAALAISIFAAFEGALVAARVAQSAVPLQVSGEILADLVAREPRA
ncbi:TetR/AcrR family transcriptional regulator [Ferrovibrio sp.]|uniref:TetR/AcrR family transcriptional regulator n=1 Tax=Ferrovibrio sp. TaxID=1917215 RepID=UPI00260FBD9D|nr:TetR/AcrR family transcriptional regulator [Ferrovibrio sp.]